jgi:hypothetical protein
MRNMLVAGAAGAVIVFTPITALAAAQQSTNAARPVAVSTTVNRQIPLTAGRAYAAARGSAQYQAQPGQREFQIEVERLTALHGRPLVVRVNGTPIGTMTVSNRGIAQLTLNSELGQRVPQIRTGSAVTIQTTTGAVIGTGRF